MPPRTLPLPYALAPEALNLSERARASATTARALSRAHRAMDSSGAPAPRGARAGVAALTLRGRRLSDALDAVAFAALRPPPGLSRPFVDEQHGPAARFLRDLRQDIRRLSAMSVVDYMELVREGVAAFEAQQADLKDAFAGAGVGGRADANSDNEDAYDFGDADEAAGAQSGAAAADYARTAQAHTTAMLLRAGHDCASLAGVDACEECGSAAPLVISCSTCDVNCRFLCPSCDRRVHTLAQDHCRLVLAGARGGGALAPLTLRPSDFVALAPPARPRRPRPPRRASATRLAPRRGRARDGRPLIPLAPPQRALPCAGTLGTYSTTERATAWPATPSRRCPSPRASATTGAARRPSP